jgi:tRNA dimethylallyltransferase
VTTAAIGWQRVVGRGAPRATPLPEVIGVFGPTASGKSAVAEALADRLGTEVVSADALQVYRGLPVLTNQPERPTRLVSIRELTDEMSVGEYEVLAHEAVDELVDRTGVAIVAGGTGLYFRAALGDLAVPPPPEPGAREELERAYDASPARAHARLAELDPGAAALVHPNDRRRVVRALELAEMGASLMPGSAQLWSAAVRRPSLVVGLDVPRDVLEQRIRERAASLVARGVLDEVRATRATRLSRTAEKALGLLELRELPVETALEQLSARTIRYAAYQRKWMRRIPGIVMIDADRPAQEVADAILEVARAR